MKKFPDIFTDRILIENATKKRQVQDRFKELAKKVFIKPTNQYPELKLEPTVSTPVHHHLFHKCPEQWTHNHQHYENHLGHHLHHATYEVRVKSKAPKETHASIADVAMMAMKFDHNKEAAHPHHDTEPPLEKIEETDESVKPSETTEETENTTNKKDDLNDSREVNLPKSGSHSQAGSDTAFEDEPEDHVSQLVGQFPQKRSVVKMNDENFDEIKTLLNRGEMSLGITLLKRLRKYKLISSTINHDGRIIVGISPRVEGRIKVVS